MSITHMEPSPESLSRRVASEIRATLARQGLNQSDLARRLGVGREWVNNRIGARSTVDLRLDEIAEMTKALGVSTEGLLLYAIRDSNPEPAVMEQSALTSADVVDLGAYRAGRAA